MYRIQPIQTPSLAGALTLIFTIIAIISTSIIIFDAPPHVPLIIVILLLTVYGYFKQITYKEMEEGIVEGAQSGLSAVFLFFFIGILIASWLLGGTIPTLIYAGFEIVTPNYYYAIVFIVTSVIGISVGSSLTSVGTIGLAFIGISSALGVSLPITAGAIVSGAFFGDKMSPLSDTTNMASSILGVDLFEHIQNMLWTTIPSFLISLIIFGIMSPEITTVDFEQIETFQAGLVDTGLVSWYSGVLPLAVLIIFSIRKAPALLSLAAGSVTAIIISFFNGLRPMSEVFGILFGGYTSDTGVEEIDELLTRGGMESMLFTIGLVLLALGMGGLLFKLGIVPRLLASIESVLKKVSSVITASALSAIGINVLIGEQYLSILLTTESFSSHYEKVGLANKNLSRVAEDAGTVVNPLVPWSVTAVFITSVLGVATIDYLPFAFFSLFSPILTVLFGYLGTTLTYLNGKETKNRFLK